MAIVRFVKKILFGWTGVIVSVILQNMQERFGVIWRKICMGKNKKRYDGNHVLLRLNEYQRKDGMYLYKYRDEMGEMRIAYSKVLAELREKEKRINRDLEDGILTGRRNAITVNDMFRIYMRGKMELKEKTRVNYEYLFGKYVSGKVGKEKIGEVKYSQVKQFYLYMVREAGFKLSSLEIIHTILHSVFSLAVRDDYIRKNPAEGALTELKKDYKWHRPKRHGLTEEEQRAFLSYVSGSERYRGWIPLFVLLLGTGCRIGEMIGLTWRDCDFKKNLIDINHSTSYHRKKNQKFAFSIGSPKSEAARRKIPMLGAVRRTLLELQEEGGCESPGELKIDGYTGFVLRNRNGSLYNPSCVNRTINRIVKAHNREEVDRAEKEGGEPLLLPHFSAHSLRHTFCCRLCENETNIKVIQEIMGHSDIATTMNIYAEIAERKKQEVFCQLDGKIPLL